MFKKNYKFAICADQSDEAFKALCEVFQTFGEITNLSEVPIKRNEDDVEVDTMLVFDLRAKKRKFDKMIEGLKAGGMHPMYIKGYWLM